VEVTLGHRRDVPKPPLERAAANEVAIRLGAAPQRRRNTWIRGEVHHAGKRRHRSRPKAGFAPDSGQRPRVRSVVAIRPQDKRVRLYAWGPPDMAPMAPPIARVRAHGGKAVARLDFVVAVAERSATGGPNGEGR